MIEIGTHWKYDIGDVVIVVVGNTTIREVTGDVPGVIVKRLECSNATKLEIPVSSLLRFYAQLTPLEVELL